MKVCPKCGAKYPDTTTLCSADGAVLEQTEDTLLGKTLAGKYRVDERLSVGGMGTVYRGTHVLMDKTVAIKVLRPALAADEKIVARFSREARAASRISHPHALSVTDFGEAEDGVVFLVMEYLRGKTLKEIVREGGPMPLTRVIEIMRQVGGALDAAHAQGVVHRDLKSDNIMLLTTNGADYAKVLDFGIAKINEPEDGYDPGLTAPDLVIGTPQYMSPEQCSQSPDIDARSDLYSLGVVLYEMLVGHVPFTGDSPTAVMMKHLQEPAPSLLNERPDLPASVAHVVSRAMAKLPQNRYQSVAELVEDLTVAGGMDDAFPAYGDRTVPRTLSADATPADSDDEETVVQPRPRPSRTQIPIAVPSYAPPAGSNFNPWKILVPSLAALVVIFVGIYFFTRNREVAAPPASTDSTLVTDPNSQPVEPAQPATGKSEEGIPAGGATKTAAVNANANASNSPVEGEDINGNVESQEPSQNVNQANSNNAPPSPTVALPSPSRQVNTNEAPVSSPGAKPATPKPTLPPPKVSPSAENDGRSL